MCPDWIALNFLLLPRTQTLRLSSFSFPWSISLRHQSLGFRFGLCAKYEAPEGWQSSDTEQVACSRRSDRGDAWNRLLNMSFIMKLVRPRQMFFFLFFSSPSCFLAILWSSAASINNWPSYLTSSQLDFTDFANNAKITHVA